MRSILIRIISAIALSALMFACTHTQAPADQKRHRMLADDDGGTAGTSMTGNKPVPLPGEPSQFQGVNGAPAAAMADDAEAAKAAYSTQQARPQPIPDEPRPPSP